MEEGGEEMVEQGSAGGAIEQGDGEVVQANPPPKKTLPLWLPKALGAGSVAAHKAQVIPWSTKALQESRATDSTRVCRRHVAHMTLDCVFCHLVRCQIPRHAERKGTWRRDNERAGTWTWGALASQPMNPVPEAISVGCLSSLNLCGDHHGVQFRTANFLVALQHWVSLGFCRQWR